MSTPSDEKDVSPDEFRRRVQALLDAAGNPTPDADFTKLAEGQKTEILLEAISMMASSGPNGALLAARRDAASAVVQARLHRKSVGTMETLGAASGRLTRVALLLAVVQAAAAAVYLLGAIHDDSTSRSLVTPEKQRASEDADAPEFYPRRSTWWGLILIPFPRRLAEYATDVDTQRFSTAPSAAFLSQNERSARYLRKAHISAFLWVVVFMGIGWSAGKCLAGTRPGGNLGLLTVVGIGILLWATLALGYSLRTFDGTLIENVDVWAYRLLYLVGSALLALDAGLNSGR
jgi:hypothetical protein